MTATYLAGRIVVTHAELLTNDFATSKDTISECIHTTRSLVVAFFRHLRFSPPVRTAVLRGLGSN